MRKSIILGFSGRIGSGKTTLSQGVASALSWPIVSFGDFVRKKAISRGLDCSRENLQKLGCIFLKDCDNFCNNVLKDSGWINNQDIVVEGIRNVKIADALKRINHESEFFLVFIELDESEREVRIRTRNRERYESIKIIEKHLTEFEVINSLPNIADFIVDGIQDKEIIISEIINWINQKLEHLEGGANSV